MITQSGRFVLVNLGLPENRNPHSLSLSLSLSLCVSIYIYTHMHYINRMQIPNFTILDSLYSDYLTIYSPVALYYDGYIIMIISILDSYIYIYTCIYIYHDSPHL